MALLKNGLVTPSIIFDGGYDTIMGISCKANKSNRFLKNIISRKNKRKTIMFTLFFVTNDLKSVSCIVKYGR